MKGGRHREKVPIEYKYDIGQEKKRERNTRNDLFGLDLVIVLWIVSLLFEETRTSFTNNL